MTTGITLEIPAKAEYLSLVRAVVVSAAALDPAVEDQRLEDADHARRGRLLFER